MIIIVYNNKLLSNMLGSLLFELELIKIHQKRKVQTLFASALPSFIKWLFVIIGAPPF